MRKALILYTVILASCFIACKKESNPSITADKVTGKWLTVSMNDFRNDSGIVVEWGLFYVGTLGINADKTFIINDGIVPIGTWELKNDGSTIEFYSKFGTEIGILKDTSEFNVSINSKDELVLQRGATTFRHRRL